MSPAAARNEDLLDRYAKVVRLDQLRKLADDNERLSGLFVGIATDAYLKSPRKVLLVGKETAGWNRGLPHVRNFDTVEAYLQSSMRRHEREFAQPRPGSKFFQFHRRRTALAGSTDPGSVAWGNLFCCDHAGGSPKKAKGQFGRISDLSRQLLRVQIDVLQPDVIFFVTGHGYDRQLKATVTIRCSKVHRPKKVWEFRVGKAVAFRTSHPQWEKDREHREDAIQIAMDAVLGAGAAMEAVQG